MNFDTESSAALAMLGEAAGVLRASRVDYTVVGGWVPYLFNQGALKHPGTFDVDALLHPRTRLADMEEASRALTLAGYLRAPKNRFQLHRLLTVSGEQQVFHVDFLHPRYAPDQDGLLINWGSIQSIAGPGSDIVYERSERDVFDVSVILPSGEGVSTPICFASETALITMKARALGNEKRTRDAYDIYLMTMQSRDQDALRIRLRTYYHVSPLFRESFNALMKGFLDERILRQVSAHIAANDPEATYPSDSAEVCRIVSKNMIGFLESVP